MGRYVPWLLSLMLVVGASAADAADIEVSGPAPEPRVVEIEPPPIVRAPGPATGPLAPPPQVRYGCQRVWRCDTTVCEWRRGCWGVYGYIEGPYYTSTFARRQWESHGLPVPPRARY